MRPDQLALLEDARVSREARLMGLYLSRFPGEELEVSTEDWQRLLGKGPRGYPKRQSIAGHAQELELLDYIERRPGGAGSPRYRYRLPTPQGTVERSTVPPGDGKHLTPTVPPGDGSHSTVPPGDILASPQGTVEASPPPPPNPPPPPPPLAPMAEEAIGREEDLAGCRGALRDYLRQRVEPENQHGYAMTVLGWIQGTHEATWADGHGNHLREDRAAVIADALNQLRAGDEVGPYFPGPPGDIRNLQKKVRYLVRGILGSRRDATRNGKEDGSRQGIPGSSTPPRGGPRQPSSAGRYAGADHRGA